MHRSLHCLQPLHIFKRVIHGLQHVLLLDNGSSFSCSRTYFKTHTKSLSLLGAEVVCLSSVINTSYVQLACCCSFNTEREERGMEAGADNVFHQVESTTHKRQATNFHIMLKSLNPFSVKARVEASRAGPSAN